MSAVKSSLDRRQSVGPEDFSTSVKRNSSDLDLVRHGASASSSASALPSCAAYKEAHQNGEAMPFALPVEANSSANHSKILAQLATKKEWSSLAHRGCIDALSSSSSSSSSAGVYRKTAIICTIGPNTNSPQALYDLRRSGMNIMRMNFSHGDHAYHQTAIENLRASFGVGQGPPVAIALDTKGPEIRTGSMSNSQEVELVAGSQLTVTTDVAFKNACDTRNIYVDYANLPKIVQLGSLIFIDDGLISLKVLSIAEDLRSVRCEVVNTGKLNSKKGVNLPGLAVDLPSISEQDAKDLAFGVANNVDIIFASFIRKREDILNIRRVLGEKGSRIMIIAKIENAEGVENFDSILEATDGVMVARGDLGIEIPVQKVFLAQKMMIAKCNVVGKPVICATQMLESMTFNPRPTRAEVSDVGNAVIDGADCVMLSGETAKGKYPLECVRMMNEICLEAERTLHFLNFFHEVHSLNRQKHTNETLAAAAVNASFEQEVQAIITLSVSGNTARLVAKYRPQCPIICITTDEVTSRQLHLTRGVYPVYCPLTFDPSLGATWAQFIDQMVTYGIQESQRFGHSILKPGHIAMVVQGWTQYSGHTNTIRVIRV